MDKDRSQNETIQKLCTNRRHQNFQYLKEWDKTRAQILMTHRKLIDELDESISTKIRQSNAYIDVVRQFLTDLLTQKIKYELQVVNNPESKIKNNLAGKSIYRNSANNLGRMYQITNNYKGYKKLKAILQVSLAKVEELLVQSQKTIMEMKTKIELTINEIQNSNQSALELCNTIIGMFKEQKNMKSYQCQRDGFVVQQEFMYQAFVQTEVQRGLGVEVVRYVQYLEQLEKQKLVVIKEVIGSYLQGIKEDHEDQVQLNLLQDILKKDTENKYIEECYSGDQLFPKAIIKDLADTLGVHEKQVDLKFIKNFMTKLQYNHFGYINYLVMKEYHIFAKIGSQLQQITLLLTVDGFLNFYFSRNTIQITNNSQQILLESIDYSSKIDGSLLLRRHGDINLQIQSKKTVKRSLQLEDMKSVMVVFSNEDQREEFLQFIQRILD